MRFQLNLAGYQLTLSGSLHSGLRIQHINHHNLVACIKKRLELKCPYHPRARNGRWRGSMRATTPWCRWRFDVPVLVLKRIARYRLRQLGEWHLAENENRE